MPQDDRRTIPRDDEDTANHSSKYSIGTTIALHPIVYPTTADLYTRVLAVSVHAEGTQERIRASDGSGELTLVLREGGG